MDESCEWGHDAHLHYPYRCLLLAPQYPLRANNTSVWVNGAVHDVDGYNMGAVLIGIFVPHPDDDVRPWMTAQVEEQAQADDEGGWERTFSNKPCSHEQARIDSLVVEELREVMHFVDVMKLRGV